MGNNNDKMTVRRLIINVRITTQQQFPEHQENFI